MNDRTEMDTEHKNDLKPAQNAENLVPEARSISFQSIQSAIERNVMIVNPETSVSQVISMMSNLNQGLPSSRLGLNSVTGALGVDFDPKESGAEKNLEYKGGLKEQFSYVLVMQEKHPVSVITRHDLAKLVNSNADLTKTKISEIVQQPVTLLSESKLKQFFKTFSIFKQYWLRHLPVVDDRGQVVGIITPESVRQVLQEPDELQSVHQTLAQKTAECRHITRQLQQEVDKQEQLEEKLQWHGESERIIGTIVQTIQQSSELKKVFEKTVTLTQSFLQADRVCIYKFHSDWSSAAVAEAVSSEFPAILGFLIRNQLVSGEEWIREYHQGHVCIVNDVSSIDSAMAPALANAKVPVIDNSTDTLLQFFQIKAKLAVPIQCGKKLWGLLIVHQCSAPRQWQKVEIDFLKRVTRQLGIAVEDIHLRRQVEQLQDHLKTQAQEYATRLRQSLDFEAMLQRITDRVRDSLDERQILQTAVQELVTVLGVYACQAALCEMIHPESCSINHQYITFPALPSNQAENAIDSLELCLQLRQGNDCQFCMMQPFLNQGKESILVCPIFDDQGYLGSLRLYAPRSYVFDDQAIRLVQQVASHCAIAIRQARLFQAAQTQVTELERLHQLKDDFLSTISHELRTPLSSIKMVTNLLKLALNLQEKPFRSESETPNPQAEKLTQYLKVLEDECDREINLVNDLLTTQHLNAGIHPLSYSTIQLQDWIAHIVETFHHRAQLHQQTLITEVPNNLPSLVSDSFMLSRILVELLNNACKYTPAGETISVTAKALSPAAPAIQISVSNSGAEIAAEELTRIFDPFYRIPNDDPWKRGGTGLGLSLTKKLVEYLGGNIRVESRSNQVCFTVELPLVPEGEEIKGLEGEGVRR